ncbi:uncharacterized protein LOC143850043 [Tasmannia lanceolata]|uniref:uncharacterized protein LOC143850043 n=1 Tax=Tasmannia lanceolata TaxID=3420 RepID=UPI0040638DBC
MGNPSQAGIAGVLRNERGKVVWAFAGPIGVMDAMEAEVQATQQSIKLVVSHELNDVVIEGGSLNIIKRLHGFLKNPWRFDSYFNEISAYTRSLAISFHHVCRSANKEADKMARLSAFKETLALYDAFPP